MLIDNSDNDNNKFIEFQKRSVISVLFVCVFIFLSIYLFIYLFIYLWYYYSLIYIYDNRELQL